MTLGWVKCSFEECKLFYIVVIRSTSHENLKTPFNRPSPELEEFEYLKNSRMPSVKRPHSDLIEEILLKEKESIITLL